MIIGSSIHPLSVATTAFMASLVEFVEALTIVLAVGLTRGWKSAIWGTVTGVAVLVVLVIALGPILAHVPLVQLRWMMGLLLLLFGLRWLRKATLRSGCIVALHDEQKIFEGETIALARDALGSNRRRWDGVAFIAAFKAIVIEGAEVVFIVVATSSGQVSSLAATLGASVAGLIVIILGLLIHRPLTRVPENLLKYLVGVLLSSFGVFWIGESFGYEWVSGDFIILWIAMCFAGVSQLAVAILRSAR